MNPGIIKWNVVVTATIDKKKISKKDIKDAKKEIKDFIGTKSDVNVKKFNIRNLKKKIIIKSEFNKDINSPYKLDFSLDGIQSLMKWFPKVIEDRDWDHSYIIDALRFKIQNTCKYIETKQRHLNWENDVRYMKLALKLMDKLWPADFSEDKAYESEYTDYHVSEHKFVPLTKEEEKISGKGSKRMEITEISENFNDYFALNKSMHKKAKEYIKNNSVFTEPESKYTQAMVISKLKHEKARKLLFNILENKIESWWD